MKKIFSLIAILTFAIIAVLASSLKASAVLVNTEDVGKNKLDPAYFYKTAAGHAAYSEGIHYERGHNYTLVAAKEFFGSAYTQGALQGNNRLTIRYVVDDDNNSGYMPTYNLQYRPIGFFVSSFNCPVDGTIYFDDLRTPIESKEDIRTDLIMLFEGEISDFKGFVQNVDLSNYEYNGDQDIVITTECTNPITPQAIKDSIVAFDTTDGIIQSDQITVLRDTYTGNMTTGTHIMEFQATDSSNNTRNLIVTINVVDTVAPVISLKNEIEWEVRGVIPTIADIRNYFVVRDNYDGLISPENLYDFQWVTRTFNGYETGRYRISIKCADSSGNVAVFEGYFMAVDTTPPVVDFNSVEIKLSELGTNLETLTETDFTNYCSDNSRYITKIYVEANYGVELETYVGIIPIKLTVIDGAGNITVKEGVISVIDDIAPTFYVKSTLLALVEEEELTHGRIHQEIRKNLKQRGILYDHLLIVSSDLDFEDPQTGVYNVKYAYSYQNNVVYEMGQIEVLNTKGKADNNTENLTPAPNPQTPTSTGDGNVQTGDMSVNQTEENDDWLYFLVLIPILVGVIIYISYRRKNRIVR